MRKLLTLALILTGFTLPLHAQQSDMEKMQMEREMELQKEQAITPKFIKETQHAAYRAIECMPEATYSYAPVNYETGVNSNADAGYRVAHRVTGFDYPIMAIRIFGIQAFQPGTGWVPMNDVDPFTFEFKFYNDNGGVPGSEITELASTVNLNHQNTGEMFAGSYNIYYWDYEPGSPIAGLPEIFWISAANTNTDAWFLWVDNTDGVGTAMQLDMDAGTWSTNDYPAGLCLVPVLAEPGAPAEPTNLNAAAGANGALSATITWTNPNETFDGSTLTNLDKITLVVNDDFENVEHTINNPSIGGAETYNFATTESGVYKFSVFGTNSEGDGPSAVTTIYIGVDKPGAPTNVVLTPTSDGGHISWDAPTTGLNEGYINPAEVTYTLVRMPNTIVAEEITATEYNDDFNPGIGNYQYKVIAHNEIGEGGSALSNVALLGAEGILLYETFSDVTVGQIPAGWSIEGVTNASWTVQNSINAGGVSPEMRLYWSPQFTGMSRLVTHGFSPDGRESLRLRFKHMLNNFSVVTNTIAAQVSFDGGEWQNLWEELLTASISAQEKELYIDVPGGTTEVRIGWEFDGDVYQINGWFIDDIIVEPVVDKDLAAVSISGNTTPSANAPTTYTVTIVNAGTDAQSNYTVKLMKEGGIEVDSQAGTPIDFAETLEYQLTWTPQASDVGETYIYGEVVLDGDEIVGNNKTGNLLVVVQPEGVSAITIGTGTTLPTIRVPFDFYRKNSFAQTIYYADEIGIDGGALTTLAYYNNFQSNLSDKEVRVWMGEIDGDNLTGGWESLDNLTLVYEGTIDFPGGENTIIIPLDDPYIYNGGNLLIFTNRVWEDSYASSNDKFYGTEDANSKRTRYINADGTGPLDPTNLGTGTASDWFPNTTLFFSTEGLGSLEGIVTDSQTSLPVEGVEVSTATNKAKTLTDEDGKYFFEFMIPGNHNISFERIGYFTRTGDVAEIIADATTTLDVTIDPKLQYSITGVVVDKNENPIEDAAVTLSGYASFETTTNASGVFTIDEVFEHETPYTLAISKVGFETYIDNDIMVNDTQADELGVIDLGNINMVGVMEIIIGEGNTLPSMRIPFDFYWKNSFSQTIYYAEEIELGGAALTSVAYTNNFTSNLTDKEIKVWVGETDATDLSSGWSPLDNLTLVYEGPMDFPSGDNLIRIRFDEPYIYSGENLLIYTNRFWEDQYAASTDKFYGTEDTGSNRTRYHYADGTGPLDPVNPGAGTLTSWHPNTILYFSTDGLGEIEGTVIDEDNNPLEGVDVYANAVKAKTTTNAQGKYSIILLPGNYSVTFDKFGYVMQTISNVEVEADGVTVVDATLAQLPTLNVKGVVKGNDNELLEGATVTLTGFDNYTTTTGEGGQFTIENVYEHAAPYTLTISIAGYETYVDENIMVTQGAAQDGVIDLGTITIEEIIAQPYGLTVTLYPDKYDQALLSWNKFEEFFDDFESYEDFIIADIGDYTLYDGDGSATYTFSGIDFPNATYTGSYIIFNPSQTTPDLTGTEAIQPHSGEKFIGCFAATNGPNNDWLISHEIAASSGLKFSFWAKTYMDYGLEKFRVAVSTTDTDVSSFEFISEATYAPLDNWAHFEYDLTEFAGQNIYVAIVCLSDDVFIFMVDDLYIGFGEEKSAYENPKAFFGFNVYLDGVLLTPEPISETDYLLTGLEANTTYVAAVDAAYSSGNTEKVEIIFTTVDPNAVPEISLSELKVYPNPFSSHISISHADLVNRIVITNALGQKVKDIYLNGENYIGTDELAQGVYLITFQGFNGETTVRRMVKQ